MKARQMTGSDKHCLAVKPRSGSVKVVSMVGSNESPGCGTNAYLHIKAEYGGQVSMAYICGRETLRAIAHMILYGIGDREQP